MIVLDFEASGLIDSYPISVGVAAGDGRLYYRLIKPEPDWDTMRWDPRSEQVHKLTREVIEAQGIRPKQVMAELNALFRDETLVSDNPPFEWRWLNLLEAFGGRAAFRLSSIGAEAILTDAATDACIDASSLGTINRLRRTHATHNALSDAASWLAAAEAIAGWMPGTAEGEIEAVFADWCRRVEGYLQAGRAGSR